MRIGLINGRGGLTARVAAATFSTLERLI